MNLIIRQATVADPRSPHYGQQVDLHLSQGKIVEIGQVDNETGIRAISGEGLVVAPGFTDIFASFGDPGFEYKETLETGAASAAAGGYTRVIGLPNTQPAIHSKSQVEYIVQKGKELPAQVIPYGAITKNTEGKELAEMYDMRQSGAIAFTDGLRPLQNSQVMLKALQYVKAFDGLLVQVPDEESLSKHGLINEGIVSTRLGLPGKPILAETLLLARDIELLRYTGSRLHVTGISSAESVALIQKAKAEGLNITCSVTPYHLHFTDEDLATYDTNLKLNPPLRTAADRDALKAAVLDGTIDCIASHHQPHEWDSKTCEFEYAKYGMEGLETCVAAVKAALPQISNGRLAELFAINPAVIFGLPLPPLEANQAVMLTLYSVAQPSVFEKEKIKSKSVNNAFIGKTFDLKIIGTINHQLIHFNS
jgi:dihydroorotase